MLVQVSFVLPYLLRLPDGDYPGGSEKDSIALREEYVETNGVTTKLTVASSEFEARSSVLPEEELALKDREANTILRRTNSLLRWYRVETRQAAVVEVTKAQASPFVFKEKLTNLNWGKEFFFEVNPPVAVTSRSGASLAKAIRAGMASNNDPEVSRLFLLDAEQALRDGRFREAVLFCWSTIDATFNIKYEAIVDEVLAREWAEGRNWLKDNRFGMKNKMSAVLFLVTGRSLYREQGNLWRNLAESYTKRNSIIHRGETAQEADAELALQVARDVVNLMASLKPKNLKPKK